MPQSTCFGLQPPTGMALDGYCVNMALRLFVVPLLIPGFPDFSLAALPAREWPVEIKLGKAPTRIDVREPGLVGCYRRGVILLLDGSEAQHSLRLSPRFFTGISA